MRPSHFCLAAIFFVVFLAPAFSQTVPMATESTGEVLPEPAGPDASIGPEVAYIVPKERAVTINLSVDRPPVPRKAQFKLKRSGQVLAETLQPRPEQLEFEVLIEGPVCDVPVCLPVSSASSINSVYAEHAETNPERVVSELAKLGVPAVRVVAILRKHVTERHDGDGFLREDCFELWTPYYRVAFKDAAIPSVLVKVPRVDCELYRMTERAVANSLCHRCELPLLTITQGNPGSHRHVCHHCHAIGCAKCRCQGETGYYPPQVMPRTADDPVQAAPPGAVPAAPGVGDPFTDDAA